MIHGDALDDPGRLPWTLTLHFRADEYPSAHLMRMDKRGFMHDTFMNSVKEADQTRNGSAGGVMSMGEAESKKMWEALQQCGLRYGKCPVVMLTGWQWSLTSFGASQTSSSIRSSTRYDMSR